MPRHTFSDSIPVIRQQLPWDQHDGQDLEAHRLRLWPHQPAMARTLEDGDRVRPGTHQDHGGPGTSGATLIQRGWVKIETLGTCHVFEMWRLLPAKESLVKCGINSTTIIYIDYIYIYIHITYNNYNYYVCLYSSFFIGFTIRFDVIWCEDEKQDILFSFAPHSIMSFVDFSGCETRSMLHKRCSQKIWLDSKAKWAASKSHWLTVRFAGIGLGLSYWKGI